MSAQVGARNGPAAARNGPFAPASGRGRGPAQVTGMSRRPAARPLSKASNGYPRKSRLAYSAAMAVLAVILISVAAVLSGAVLFWKRSSRRVGAPPQRATYGALHTASQAVSVLREGLTADGAVKAAPSLRHLLGTPTVAIADQASLLVCHGSDQHAEALARHLRDVVTSGHSQ